MLAGLIDSHSSNVPALRRVGREPTAAAQAWPLVSAGTPRFSQGRGQRWPRLRSIAFVGAAPVVMLLVIVLVTTRETIARVAPAIAPFYEALGLPVKPPGLNIHSVRSILMQEEGGRVLAIEGEIDNNRGSAMPIPELHVALRNSDGREIYTWTTPPPKAKLAAGESVAFRARLAAPPETAQQVSVRFAATEPKQPGNGTLK
jgi:hypothetical protein